MANDLLAYEPIFEARAEGEVDLDQRGYDNLYGALVRTMDLSAADPTVAGQLGEELFKAAAARCNILTYPASPREEASAKRAWNHDCYILSKTAKGYQKLPLQIKINLCSGGYKIPVVHIKRMARQALGPQTLIKPGDKLSEKLLKMKHQNHVQFAKDYHALREAMSKERQGKPLHKVRARALDTFCESIAALCVTTDIAA